VHNPSAVEALISGLRWTLLGIATEHQRVAGRTRTTVAACMPVGRQQASRSLVG
jgi:hypothetical protein